MPVLGLPIINLIAGYVVAERTPRQLELRFDFRCPKHHTNQRPPYQHDIARIDPDHLRSHHYCWARGAGSGASCPTVS